MLNLHVHSQYSTLDGLSTVKEIVARAKSLHAPAVAITDHASISSLPELMKEAEEAGIKPIVGCEFYVIDSLEGVMKEKKRIHLCVWAKNWNGVLSIMSQLSLANRQFYRRPVLTIAQAMDFQDCMVGTACCFGIMSDVRHRDYAKNLLAAYGEDFYMEIMPHTVMIDGVDLQRQANIRAIDFGAKNGVKFLATNDSHYTLEEDAVAHNIMMCTQYNKRVGESEPWPPVFFMRSMEQMFTAFMGLGYIDNAIAGQAMMNTISFAEKVNIVKPEFKVNLPTIYENEGRFLMDSCLAGWKAKLDRKIGDQYAVYRKRLVYELGVIKGAGFIPYFLMVQDIIAHARSKGIIVGPARGSAAGSLVCYLMDITRVDPIKHGLFFERFLNPERTDLPDIDVDFQDDRRSEVLEYIVEKYGRDKVCQISTFNQMQVKGAFRDVARVHGIDMMTVNKLSLQLEEVEDFDTVPELVKFAEKHPDIVGHAKRLNGVIRGVGQHACGIVISSQSLENVCAIERRKGDNMATCWDKDQCEAFGLVKVDILGLTTLSIIDQTVKNVKKFYGVDIVLEEIPLDDVDVIESLGRGEGNCIFQFESHGMQDLLRGLKVKHFDTLVAATALYRPGPLQAGLTDRYAKVARGEEYARYPIPELEPILESTNSVLVYQEQIMKVFSILGGFSWAEADKMRKIIGKKLGADAFEAHREHFAEGCARNGIDAGAASSLFDDMVKFAAYSFNLSHAVAYTMISFYSAYLKAHYPAIFLAAYMSCVKSDDAITKGVQEARRLGIPIENPHINRSTTRYEYDPEAGIIAPLSVIKGVGEKAVEEILKARGGSVFFSMEDFMERVYKRVVNKRVVENLVLAGAFNSLGLTETDSELKERQEAELMPTFDTIPSLSLTRTKDVGRLELDIIQQEIDNYCDETGQTPLKSIIGKSPVLMVINSQMKSEKALATAKGTSVIFNQLWKAGVDKRFIAYASVVKNNLKDPKKVSSAERSLGESWLRREIKAIGPKLIYCCNAEALPLFSPGDKMSKLYGRIKYNREFDAYVMCGPSPQYASFRPEDAGVQYQECMDKIAKMFEVGGKDS